MDLRVSAHHLIAPSTEEEQKEPPHTITLLAATVIPKLDLVKSPRNFIVSPRKPITPKSDKILSLIKQGNALEPDLLDYDSEKNYLVISIKYSIQLTPAKKEFLLSLANASQKLALELASLPLELALFSWLQENLFKHIVELTYLPLPIAVTNDEMIYLISSAVYCKKLENLNLDWSNRYSIKQLISILSAYQIVLSAANLSKCAQLKNEDLKELKEHFPQLRITYEPLRRKESLMEFLNKFGKHLHTIELLQILYNDQEILEEKVVDFIVNLLSEKKDISLDHLASLFETSLKLDHEKLFSHCCELFNLGFNQWMNYHQADRQVTLVLTETNLPFWINESSQTLKVMQFLITHHQAHFRLIIEGFAEVTPSSEIEQFLKEIKNGISSIEFINVESNLLQHYLLMVEQTSQISLKSCPLLTDDDFYASTKKAQTIVIEDCNFSAIAIVSAMHQGHTITFDKLRKLGNLAHISNLELFMTLCRLIVMDEKSFLLDYLLEVYPINPLDFPKLLQYAVNNNISELHAFCLTGLNKIFGSWLRLEGENQLYFQAMPAGSSAQLDELIPCLKVLVNCIKDLEVILDVNLLIHEDEKMTQAKKDVACIFSNITHDIHSLKLKGNKPLKDPERIVEWICRCKNLKKLSFQKIHLKPEELQKIPGACTQITSIEFDHCHYLSGLIISNFIERWKAHLISLNIVKNSKITNGDILVILEDCSKLQELNLSGCSLISDEVLKSLSKLGHLTSLNLSECPQIFLKNELPLPQLKFLTLKRCENITNYSLQKIAPKLPKLRSINLEENFAITEEGFKSLASHCLFLKEIYLSGCVKLTDQDILPFLNLLELEFIDLSWCHLLSEEIIEQMIIRRPFLQKIMLNGCEKIPKFLWTLLAKEKQVKETMVAVGISNRTLNILSGRFPHLNTLTISHSPDITLNVFSEWLKFRKNMKSLTLLGPPLHGDDEVLCLVKNGPSLESVHLKGDSLDLTDRSLQQLSLFENRLKRLTLQNCPLITNAGLEYFAKSCSSLLELNLKGCKNISVKGLISVIKECPKLVELRVDHPSKLLSTIQLLNISLTSKLKKFLHYEARNSAG